MKDSATKCWPLQSSTGSYTTQRQSIFAGTVTAYARSAKLAFSQP